VESLAFVALDLETTGLSPSQDAVIEIGAVSLNAEGGRETFRTFVHTERKIPLPTKKLTGISETDLEGAPDFEEAVDRMSDFIGGRPVVLHNAAFDLGFLQRRWQPPAEVWDTLDLSRAVFPGLRSHGLEYLAKQFGFHPGRSHRALEDATATAALFTLLCSFLQEKEDEDLSAMQGLAIGHLRKLLAILSELKRKGLHIKPIEPVDEESAARAVGVKAGAGVGDRALGKASLGDVYGPAGSLSRVMGKDYENRDEQEQISKGVWRALENDQFLLIEAGTGVGKSLGYLLPAAIWARERQERVVVSTYTRNLQEQLFFKDIPLAQKAVGHFRAALLKGRGNYLCLRRWIEAQRYPDLLLDPKERTEAAILYPWSRLTRSGDISEHGGFNPGRAPGLWAKLSAESSGCQGQRCPYYRRCYLFAARRAAQEAEIVVVNHSLLFSDLAAEGRALPDYRRLIFDEAHNLEDAATDYLGFSQQRWEVHNYLDTVYSRRAGEAGLAAKLSQWLRGSGFRGTGGLWKKPLLELGETVLECGRLADRLYQGKWFAKPGAGGKLRYRAGDRFQSDLLEMAQELVDSLLRLSDRLQLLSEFLAQSQGLEPEEKEAFVDQLNDSSLRARTLADILAKLASADQRDYVFWAEFREQGLVLAAGPLEAGPVVAKMLYPRLATLIFTSATLTVAGGFDYFLERSGLKLVDQDRVEKICLKSPFDFASQAALAVANFLPSPKQDEFHQGVAELVEELLQRRRTGTLILFTSFDLLHRCYWRLAKAGVPVLAQGLDGNPAQILETARRNKDTIILGTNSFWEGVDLPGQALELLVITKLPFSVPNEPLVEARCQAIEAASGSAFHQYLLPEAVIRFRQGFGRLIRKRTDRGLVVLCDSRIVNADYGQVFLRSLPVLPIKICQSREELWEAASVLGSDNG